MQGTVVMLMALSGLGCHHKSCAPVMAGCYDSCYSGNYGSCYSSTQAFVAPVVDCAPMAYVAPSCYGGCYGAATSGYLPAACYDAGYMGGCYGGGWGGSCYGAGGYGGCYGGGHHKHRLFGRGLFGHHRRAAYNACCDFPVASSCYGGGGGGYGGYGSLYGSPAVYGSYAPVYSTGQGGQYGSSQGMHYGSSQQGWSSGQAPSKSMGGGMTGAASAPAAEMAAPATDAAPTPPPAPAPDASKDKDAAPPAPTPAPPTDAKDAAPAAPTPPQA